MEHNYGKNLRPGEHINRILKNQKAERTDQKLKTHQGIQGLWDNKYNICIMGILATEKKRERKKYFGEKKTKTKPPPQEKKEKIFKLMSDIKPQIREAQKIPNRIN